MVSSFCVKLKKKYLYLLSICDICILISVANSDILVPDFLQMQFPDLVMCNVMDVHEALGICTRASYA